MRISIAGRHMEVTSTLRKHVEDGLEKLRGHFDRILDANVVLSVEKHRHIAEVTLHGNGVRIHGRESSPDMYASVEAVMAKLDKQIRKFKQRTNRHLAGRHKGTRLAQQEVSFFQEETATNPEEPRPNRIVCREKLPMKAIGVEEAARELEASQGNFLVFSNVDTQQINVVYVREDGSYGLIEPEF